MSDPTASETTDDSPTRIAFVCVQNAGRSQMAYAFARREVADRGLEEEVELLTGGTRPADHVHDEVVRTMREVDIDVAGRTPREVTFEEIRDSDYVVTMGCAAEDVCPAGWAGENRDWDLEDPDGNPPEVVAGIREEIRTRVAELFEEIQATRSPTDP
ncbi:MAG: low molecular weight phosphatase family protein [Haloferacaceae archaeon]